MICPIGKRIIGLLESKGLTQRELAKRLDITEVSVSRYINGERIPHSDIIAKMASVLNTTTDFLLGHNTSEILTSDGYLDNRLRQIVYEMQDGKIDQTLELLKRAAALPEKDKKLLSEIVDRLREKL